MPSIWEQIDQLLSNYGATFGWGMLNTLFLAVVGTLVGLLIGIFIGQLRNLKQGPHDNIGIRGLKAVGRFFASLYVTVFRGTPMMVQAILLFSLFRWTDIDPAPGDIGAIFNAYTLCGMIVICINTGAYMAEIVKSGMNGVDVGQTEAARSLGISKTRTLWGITLPQAIKNCLPTIGNEYIVNVKDSSVLNVIGLTELYRSVSIATKKNYFVVAGYLIVAAIYLCLTLIAAGGLKLLENKLSIPDKVNWFGIRKEKIAFYRSLWKKTVDLFQRKKANPVKEPEAKAPVMNFDSQESVKPLVSVESLKAMRKEDSVHGRR